MSSQPPKEGDAYREELAAALARIGALEAQLAGRIVGPENAPSWKVTQLRAQRLKEIEQGSPRNIRKTALVMTLLPTGIAGVAALAGLVLGGWNPALAITLILLGLFVGGVPALTALLLAPATSRKLVAKLDQEIAEAMRLDALEADVRETKRLAQAGAAVAQVRVAEEGEIAEEHAPSTRRWEEK
jgi:hypothetical protein